MGGDEWAAVNGGWRVGSGDFSWQLRAVALHGCVRGLAANGEQFVGQLLLQLSYPPPCPIRPLVPSVVQRAET
jgi:hypothetical protein